jgi:hypothetical protein
MANFDDIPIIDVSALERPPEIGRPNLRRLHESWILLHQGQYHGFLEVRSTCNVTLAMNQGICEELIK